MIHCDCRYSFKHSSNQLNIPLIQISSPITFFKNWFSRFCENLQDDEINIKNKDKRYYSYADIISLAISGGIKLSFKYKLIFAGTTFKPFIHFYLTKTFFKLFSEITSSSLNMAVRFVFLERKVPFWYSFLSALYHIGYYIIIFFSIPPWEREAT